MFFIIQKNSAYHFYALSLSMIFPRSQLWRIVLRRTKCSADASRLEPSLLIQLVPLEDVHQNRGGHLFPVAILSVIIHKLAVRIHQIHDDGVIDNVIVVHVFWAGAKVHAERFAHARYLLVGASEANQFGGELFDVARNHLFGVALRIDGDEDGLHLGFQVGLLCCG